MQLNDIKAETSENVNKLFSLIANRIIRKIDQEERKRLKDDSKLNNVNKGAKKNTNTNLGSKKMQFLNKPQFGCKRYKMDEDHEEKIKKLQQDKYEMERRDPNFLIQQQKEKTEEFMSVDIIQEKKVFLDKINEDLNFIGMEYEKNLL